MKKTRFKKIIEKTNNKVLPYVFVGALVCGVAYSLLNENKLKQHYALTDGVVLKFVPYSRSPGVSIEYSYQVNGKLYHGSSGYANLFSSGRDSILGKHFPVAYDTTDAKNYRMLITTKDFKAFSIPFPDSLEWIKNYQRRY